MFFFLWHSVQCYGFSIHSLSVLFLSLCRCDDDNGTEVFRLSALYIIMIVWWCARTKTQGLLLLQYRPSNEYISISAAYIVLLYYDSTFRYIYNLIETTLSFPRSIEASHKLSYYSLNVITIKCVYILNTARLCSY